MELLNAPVSDLEPHVGERTVIEPSSAERNGQPLSTLPLPQLAISTPISDVDARDWEATFAAAFDKTVSIGDERSASLLLEQGYRHPQLCPIPPMDIAEVKMRSKVESMKHKKAWLQHRQKLGVHKARSDIVDALRKGWLVVVAGGPGCGRTTQLPQIAMETELFKGKRVLVVTQTATQAIATAERLREESGESSATISHAVPLDLAATAAATVVVATADVVTRMLLCNERPVGVGCIIVDDAGDFGLANVTLLMVLRDALIAAKGAFRVILSCSSAAVESSLAEYFRVINAPDHPIGRVVIEPDESAPLPRTLYLEEATRWVRRPSLIPDADALRDERAADIHSLAQLDRLRGASFSTLRSTDFAETWAPFIVELIKQHHGLKAGKAAGTTLVYLPTLAHSHALLLALQREAGLLEEVGISALDESLSKSSAVSLRLTKAAFEGAARGKGRQVVIVSGALCSGSLTFPGVDFVIDSARETVCTYDSLIQCDRVDLELCSLSALRTSRANVTGGSTDSPPIVVHLLPLATVEGGISTSDPHPLTRASSAALLHFCSVHRIFSGGRMAGRTAKTTSSKLWGGPADQPLNAERLQKLCAHAEERLIILGHATDDAAAAFGGMKPLGTIVTLLGLSCPVGRLLTFAACVGVLPEALSTAALWITGGVFAALHGDEDERNTVHGGRCYLADGAPSDLRAAVASLVLLRRTVAESPEEAFSGTGLSQLAASITADARAQLAAIVGQMQWCSPAELTAEKLDEALFNAANAPGPNGTSPLCDACITGALYPNVSVARMATSDAAAPQIAVSRLHENSESVAVVGAAPHHVVPHTTSVVATRPLEQPLLFMTAVRCRPQQRGDGAASHEGASVTLLHEAVADLPATIVFCGSGERTEVPQRTRCRGWLAPMTNVWRETFAARNLPAVSAIEPRPVQLRRFHTDAAATCTLIIDRTLRFAIPSTTVGVLLQLRTSIQHKIERLLRRERGDLNGAASGAFAWLASRTLKAKSYLRERRLLSDPQPADLTAPFHFSYNLGEPFPTSHAPGSGAPQATSGSAAAGGVGGVGQTRSSAFTGVVPSEHVCTMIRSTAEAIGKAGSRDHESTLHGKIGFEFLDPSNPHYDFYAYTLRQVAPKLMWLGDDIDDLETHLRDMEIALREELGYGSAASAGGQNGAQASGAAGDGSYTAASFDVGADGGAYQADYGQQHPQHIALPQMATQVNVAHPSAAPTAEADYQQQYQDHYQQQQQPLQQQPQQQQQQYFGGGGGSAYPSTTAPEAPGGDRAPIRIDPNNLKPMPFGVDGSGEFSAAAAQAQSTPAMPFDLSTPEGLQRFLQAFALPGSLLAAPLAGQGAAAPPSQGWNPAPADHPSTEETPANEEGGLDAVVGAQQSMIAPSFDPFYQPPQPVAPVENPLSKPPPPTTLFLDPSFRPRPAVLVYPLPKRALDGSFNLPLVLAKALGENLGVRCGPTLICGGRARIEVPNASVEQRAIEHARFACLGERLFIAPNTIFDNPNRPENDPAQRRELLERKRMRPDLYAAPFHGGGGGGGAHSFAPRPAPPTGEGKPIERVDVSGPDAGSNGPLIAPSSAGPLALGFPARAPYNPSWRSTAAQPPANWDRASDVSDSSSSRSSSVSSMSSSDDDKKSKKKKRERRGIEPVQLGELLNQQVHHRGIVAAPSLVAAPTLPPGEDVSDSSDSSSSSSDSD